MEDELVPTLEALGFDVLTDEDLEALPCPYCGRVFAAHEDSDFDADGMCIRTEFV